MRKYAVLGSRGIGGGGGSRGGPAVAKIVILRRLQRDNEIRVVLVERQMGGEICGAGHESNTKNF